MAMFFRRLLSLLTVAMFLGMADAARSAEPPAIPATQPDLAPADAAREVLAEINGHRKPSAAVLRLREMVAADMNGDFILAGVARNKDAAFACTKTMTAKSGRYYTIKLDLVLSGGDWVVKLWHLDGHVDIETDLKANGEMIYRAPISAPSSKPAVMAADDPRAKAPPQSPREAADRFVGAMNSEPGKAAPPYFVGEKPIDWDRIAAVKKDVTAPAYALEAVIASEEAGLFLTTECRAQSGQDQQLVGKIIHRPEGWYLEFVSIGQTTDTSWWADSMVRNTPKSRVLMGPGAIKPGTQPSTKPMMKQ